MGGGKSSQRVGSSIPRGPCGTNFGIGGGNGGHRILGGLRNLPKYKGPIEALLTNDEPPLEVPVNMKKARGSKS
jgi:hypothetical protein